MRAWPAAILLILAAGCSVARLPEPDADHVLERVLRASVQVLVEHGSERLRTGSGVVIGQRAGQGGLDCVILTTAHTVTALPAGATVAMLFDRDAGTGARVPAQEVVAPRELRELDLALLRGRPERCAPTELGGVPTLGAPVWAVGFPWGRGLRLVGGIVSQVMFEELVDGRGPARLMIDASVASGVSGGGVFDARTGELLGLVEGFGTARVSFHGRSDGQYVDVPMPGETYVIAGPTIRHFLQRAGYVDILGPGTRAAR